MAGRIVLFGAFDRHNLGDLLLPHVLARSLRDRPLRFAGLAARDLRGVGGHRVEALAELAPGWQPEDRLLCVGGELLTCSAEQAAVMLQPPEGLQATLAWLAAQSHERRAWVRRVVGSASPAPYAVVAPPLPRTARVWFHAVGGHDLARAPAGLRRAVLAQLARAQSLSVRDTATQQALRSAGLDAPLVPDAALLVAQCCAADIRARAGAVPQGGIALQLSAEFGDDATLDAVAAALRRLMAHTGAPVHLFCAGLAPWHDDPQVLQRLAQRLPAGAAHRVDTADVWALCALIAGSALLIASSLHARLVAMACGRPRLNLVAPTVTRRPSKAEAVAGTWELPGLPVAVPASGLEDAARRALQADPAGLAAHAQALAGQARAALAALTASLHGPHRFP